MKKLLALVLVLALCLTSIAFADEVKVAMVTDYGNITDQSFNQTTYEACKAFAEANGLSFQYYKPATDSDADRVAMIEAAINDGYTTIVLPGYAFGKAVAAVQADYSDVNFVALDVSAFDLVDAAGNAVAVESNVFCAVYQEELAGYMAGYAAVKLGYTHLGFLGGMAVPAVVRYGYGFVQGANAAAENAADVTVEYVYGNQFYGDADITAYMDTWYQTLGVQVVFACGGSIYASACEAAAKVEGSKVIGVDVDQSAQIDGNYGAGMTVTSAMKGLAATVNSSLQLIMDGEFATIGGTVATLGMVSAEDPSLNYVGIPETTQFSDSFTHDDYMAMVASIFNGETVVSNDIAAEPAVAITVNYLGTVK